jgi:hypothetical protein
MEQAQISDADLPGVWRDADESAAQGQRWTLILTGSKVGGGVLAALGGVIALDAGGIGLGPWAVLIGFSIALTSELASWVFQPEKNWYDDVPLQSLRKLLHGGMP